MDYAYFVMTFEGKPYRVYGTRNYIQPQDGDPRCIWVGNNMAEARDVCRNANRKRKETDDNKAPRLFDNA